MCTAEVSETEPGVVEPHGKDPVTKAQSTVNPTPLAQDIFF